jgi:Ca-activated chloride channel family protein
VITTGTAAAPSADARLASAPAIRDAQFEAAKVASAQRGVVTAAALDSIGMSAMSSDRRDAGTRRINGRTFILRDSVWTDARYRMDMRITTIKPFSTAYFDLIAQLPELRAAFALGERVIVVGKDRAIALAASGVQTLSTAELTAVVNAW